MKNHINKLFSLLVMCVAMLFVVVPVNAAEDNVPQSVFVDVSVDMWHFTFVQDMSSRELLTGYEDGTFRPDNVITCGEYYTILCRMKGADLSGYEMKEGDHWAKPAGIIARYYADDGEIGLTASELDAPISRKLAIKLGMKMFGYNAPTAVEFLDNPFADLPEDSNVRRAYHAYMLNAYHLGIICGDDKGDANPDGNLTRAQACKILLNMEKAELNKLENRVKPKCFDDLNIAFIGGASYSYYNDVAEAMSYIPAHMLEVFKAKGGKVIVTDEAQDKYLSYGVAEADGCYFKEKNTIVCFTHGNYSGLLWEITSTLCHEFGHFIYDEILSSVDKRLVRQSFQSEELDNFAKAIHDNYCKANVNEYFAELFARSIQPWYSRLLEGCDCKIGLGVVEKHLLGDGV